MERIFIKCCALLFMVLSFVAAAFAAGASRQVIFSYRVTVKAIPPGTRRVRIWIPRAVSDDHQSVTLTKSSTPIHLREMREASFGNHILYGELLRPRTSSLDISIEYLVTRREYSKGSYATLRQNPSDPKPIPQNLNRFIRADQLVPISGKMKDLADKNTQGLDGPVEIAHALYDYVFRNVSYDKSGKGWGRGDSLWVCESKHGNCTDFHSFFISMVRAKHIPARFEIGFPLPEDAQSGMIPGYHCWAEFYVSGPGWIPVDISEAWKNPAKHDYFFGTIDANRFKFSAGRDLVLNPRQDGPPLNYFVYPYVEVDGKPFDSIEKHFSFADASPVQASAQRLPRPAAP